MTDRPAPTPIAQGALNLYDAYAHGQMSRRDFMDGLKRYAVGGLTVTALATLILPDYAAAEQITADDPRLDTAMLDYASPQGAGDMAGYFARPSGATTSLGGIVVIHENRGLNPHIRDVARRAALAGYVAFAPDALHPLGGYPGNDDDGRALQAQRGRESMVQDFQAAAELLRDHPACSGKVACVGFCFGGSVANLMAVRQPWLSGAVPYYGGWPAADDVAQLEVPLQIHLAGLDDRVNAGWPDYQAALDANDADYEAFFYEGANHGFHNDTTPRFDPAAAELAWSRTLGFFAAHLAG
tara:strand:+ start:604 stop:1497 length:894 start_codon:yes stop_codon:yes gene_type:complete